jgi:stage II sporulation protein R
VKFKVWEGALIAALIISALCGFKISGEQEALSERVVRLHVEANSDSESDQKLKLKVRDAILDALSEKLNNTESAGAAAVIIEENLEGVEAAARAVIAAEGYSYGVAATLRTEEFPTRDYETFSLPAGNYKSLRVTIGDGEGRNWWCVVFPPICTEAVVDWDLMGLSDYQVMLITGEANGYAIKFRALEILAKIKSWFS